MIIVAAVFSPKKKDEAATTASGISTYDAEDRVRETVRDPPSAKFRRVREGRDGTVCGEVNAKNAFGAYVGYQPFVVAGNGTAFVIGAQREENDMVLMAVQKYC